MCMEMSVYTVAIYNTTQVRAGTVYPSDRFCIKTVTEGVVLIHTKKGKELKTPFYITLLLLVSITSLSEIGHANDLCLAHTYRSDRFGVARVERTAHESIQLPETNQYGT